MQQTQVWPESRNLQAMRPEEDEEESKSSQEPVEMSAAKKHWAENIIAERCTVNSTGNISIGED